MPASDPWTRDGDSIGSNEFIGSTNDMSWTIKSNGIVRLTIGDETNDEGEISVSEDSVFTAKTVRTLVEPVVNVKAFGAMGTDGEVDDTEPIMNAINSLDGGRGTVYFPAGIYGWNANNPDPELGIALANHQALWGDGKDVTILRALADPQLPAPTIYVGNLNQAAFGPVGQMGVFGNLTVDGADTVGDSADPEAFPLGLMCIRSGANRLFLNLGLEHGGWDNLVVEALQNSTFVGLHSTNGGRDCLVFDRGAKNIALFGTTLSTGGRHDLRITMTDVNPSQDQQTSCERIHFYGGIFEEASQAHAGHPVETVKVESCDSLTLDGVEITARNNFESAAILYTNVNFPAESDPPMYRGCRHNVIRSCQIKAGHLGVECDNLGSEGPVQVLIDGGTWFSVADVENHPGSAVACIQADQGVVDGLAKCQVTVGTVDVIGDSPRIVRGKPSSDARPFDVFRQEGAHAPRTQGNVDQLHLYHELGRPGPIDRTMGPSPSTCARGSLLQRWWTGPSHWLGATRWGQHVSMDGCGSQRLGEFRHIISRFFAADHVDIGSRCDRQFQCRDMRHRRLVGRRAGR